MNGRDWTCGSGLEDLGRSTFKVISTTRFVLNDMSFLGDCGKKQLKTSSHKESHLFRPNELLELHIGSLLNLQHSKFSTGSECWSDDEEEQMLRRGRSSRLAVYQSSDYINTALRTEILYGTKEREKMRPRKQRQASTVLDLMAIRNFHSEYLRGLCLGTALGHRSCGGHLTKIPAIIAFVTCKVHAQWLLDVQKLPSVLEGPDGVWCDVDVMELSFANEPTFAPLEWKLPHIGSDSQGEKTRGTLGAVVQSRTGSHAIGLFTNYFAADDPEKTTGKGLRSPSSSGGHSPVGGDFSAGQTLHVTPGSGAVNPLPNMFDVSKLAVAVKGAGELGQVVEVDFKAPIGRVVGKTVVKMGSKGQTRGLIAAYAVKLNYREQGHFLIDFLIVGEDDIDLDDGSLVSLTEEGGKIPRPIAMTWSAVNMPHGRIKLRKGNQREVWTSAVDLSHLLERLDLQLITTSTGRETERMIKRKRMMSAREDRENT